jgi:hypothetical protein
MKAERDPLASHIFVSRRHYRNAKDTKGGKRREMNARLSFNKSKRVRNRTRHPLLKMCQHFKVKYSQLLFGYYF